jgi:hypothetical protein
VYFRSLLRAICLVAGASALLLGLACLLIAWSGAFRSGENLAVAVGTGFLLLAAPLIVFFYSKRRAKPMAVGLLLLLASAMLWLAFRPGVPVDRPMMAQAATIAFAVLLIARVGLALRRKYSRRGT